MAIVPTPSIRIDRPSANNTVGTVVALAGLTVEEAGFGAMRQTTLTFSNVSLTLTDALAYLGTKIYDFPEGRIHVFDCTASLTFTTASAIATTLNSGVTVQWGIGSATASATTLATTMQNFMPGSGETPKTFTSSTTINVAPATATGILAAVSAAQLAAKIDGTSTAADVFLNLAVGTGTDIDGDATILVNGTILLTWVNGGDI
jgi:hypothetical protein